MKKFIKYLADNIITTAFVVGTFLGFFMGWIFVKDYYQKNVIAEKQEYILLLEQDQAEQQQEMQVYKNELEEAESKIEWMEKALEIYESEYGCL